MKTFCLKVGYLLLVSSAMLSVTQAFGQIGMMTNSPDKSAALNLSASNKGLLLPQVALPSLTDKTKISGANPAVSLWVYNTNSGLAGGVGYYYWDGSQWQKMATTADVPVAAASWNIIGNTGTTPGTNFLGTTDAKDLVVKTNGSEKIRISAGGNIGIGTATPASVLHIAGDLTLNSDLKAGGNSGNAGQVLISNGVGAAPSWQDLQTAKGVSSIQFNVSSSGKSTAGSLSFNDVPGLNYSYIAPANGTLIIELVLYTALDGNGPGGAGQAGLTLLSNTQMQLLVNNSIVARGVSTPLGISTNFNNGECTNILYQMAVTKGTTYNLNVQAQDIWDNNLTVGAYVGTVTNGTYSSPSTMIATLISN